MKFRTPKVSSVFVLLMYLFVFQELIEKALPFFKYFDEFYAFFFIILLLKKKNKDYLLDKLKDNKYLRRGLFCIGAVLVIGAISSLIFLRQPFLAVVYDVVTILKFPFAILTTIVLFKSSDFSHNRESLKKNVTVLAIYFAVLSLLNYLIVFWPSTMRYGLMSNQLFYSHPGKLSVVCVYLSVINYLVSEKPMNGTHFILSGLIISTLRAKGIGFIVLATLLFALSKKVTKRYSYGVFAAAGAIALLVAFNQVRLYYINQNSARYILTDTAIKVANDHFPIGAGFATYGSYGSVVSYSPLYHDYGIDSIAGFSEDNPVYVMDTFWPMVIAEFGYLGCIAYIGYVVFLLFDIQNVGNFKRNRKLYIAKLVCFAYLLISSTSETAFVNPMAVTLATIIGLDYYRNKQAVLGTKNNKDGES